MTTPNLTDDLQAEILRIVDSVTGGHRVIGLVERSTLIAMCVEVATATIDRLAQINHEVLAQAVAEHEGEAI